MKLYSVIKKCRICGNKNLIEVMDLGRQYLASTFVKSNRDEKLAKIKIPLTLLLCAKCGLVQLRQSANRDMMYRNYFYRSATNPMMQVALKEIVTEIMKRVAFKKGDAVLDIGCNDATMLTYFPAKIKRYGIDPAKNVDRSNLDKSIIVATEYFSKKIALELSNRVLFKAITSIAMFYDLDDPNSFVSEIKSILDNNGIWCIQLSYLPTSLKTLNFYDICHEHLTYYSLKTLVYLLNRHGLKIIDAVKNNINGGSLRVFVTHANVNIRVSSRLQTLLKTERMLKLTEKETYRQFAKRIDELKKIITDYIRNELAAGRLVIGLGASTKGNVLLQYFKIDKQMLPYLSERNPEKVGLRTLGTDIELVSEETARNLNPSTMLVMIWFFKKEIIKREANFLKKGGKLLFPMPYPHIITKKGEQRLNIKI